MNWVIDAKSLKVSVQLTNEEEPRECKNLLSMSDKLRHLKFEHSISNFLTRVDWMVSKLKLFLETCPWPWFDFQIPFRSAESQSLNDWHDISVSKCFELRCATFSPKSAKKSAKNFFKKFLTPQIIFIAFLYINFWKQQIFWRKKFQKIFWMPYFTIFIAFYSENHSKMVIFKEFGKSATRNIRRQ